MDQVHDAVAAQLRRVEQRYTPQRQVLVDVLAGAGRPLAIADIVAAAELPQSSVYRNLAVLEQAGAVRRVQAADGGARFELDEDHTEHHHHLVCTSCGTVVDYRVSEGLERSMERAIAEIVDATGFRPQAHRLDLLGTCASCR